MENASKALMMAAGVLMGMMILSLGVYLYYSLGTYITSNQERMDSNELNKFNTQFIKYINCKSDGTQEFELTIHDVVTVANLAYENNKKYNLISTTEDYGESTLYVTVNAEIKKEDGSIETINHLERNINEKSTEILSNNLETKYLCKNDDIIYSNITGRVCSINFIKIP